MNAFVLQRHRVTKRLLVDALHTLGLRGNSTTARDDLWSRLRHYLESNGLTVAPIKKSGIVSYQNRYSSDLIEAYKQAGLLDTWLSESQSLICSWFIKKFSLSDATGTIVATDSLSQNKIVIVPEEAPMGALKSLIEKGI